MVKQMKLVSIVVAVYNAEKTLKKCVDSLLLQTYGNIEIILVNDCSTDSSMSICRQYCCDNDNVHLICNDSNSGVSFTRNVGIKNASGDYICFVDSDDYAEPNYIELLCNYAEKYNTVPICGFVYHNEFEHQKPYTYAWSGGNELVSLGEASRLNQDLYLTALWNTMFVRSLIVDNNIKFDTSLSIGEDLRFSVDYFLANHIEKVYVFTDALYHYTKLNDDSLMSNYAENGYERERCSLDMIKKLAEQYNDNSEQAYQESLQVLKKSIVYVIMHSSKLNNREKKDKIRSFEPSFSNLDFFNERIKLLREKIVSKCR